MTPQAGSVVVTLGVPRRVGVNGATAPSVQAKVGQSVILNLRGLPKKATMVVRVRIDGTWVTIGQVRTTKFGRATTPAFMVSKAGPFNVQLTSSAGKKFYVKVIVL